MGQKAQLERERLLARRQISEPLQPIQREGEEIVSDQGEEELIPVSPESPGGEPDMASFKGTGEGDVSELTKKEARLKDLEATIRKLEQELLDKERGIEGWKRRWKAKRKELERYKQELIALKKECIPKGHRPLVGEPQERKKPVRLEKPVGPPLGVLKLAECEGVPISHNNVALFFSRGLNLGSDLSYAQAVMALRGLGISPGAGWNQGDPSFPMGADELEEVLFEVEKAISMGLVAADYSELTNRLRHYCERERAQLVEAPQCEGPMVTECEDCEISQGEFAIYLCKALGLGEGLNYHQSFLALAAVRISPKGGWNFEDPSTLITPRETEEVRCSVLAAHKKGLIETAPNVMVASINDYCLWLKMNVEVVGAGAGAVAEAMAQSGYQGGSAVEVPSGSQ
ncbi:MAG: hypothetical protein ACE5I8_00315 [Thermodesulfobacteriota bacterium]